MEKKSVVSITFEAPKDLARQLEAAAEDEQRPRSWVIRQLLLRALAQSEKTQ